MNINRTFDIFLNEIGTVRECAFFSLYTQWLFSCLWWSACYPKWKKKKKSFQLVRAMAAATVKRSQQEEREHGKNNCLVSFFFSVSLRFCAKRAHMLSNDCQRNKCDSLRVYMDECVCGSKQKISENKRGKVASTKAKWMAASEVCMRCCLFRN